MKRLVIFIILTFSILAYSNDLTGNDILKIVDEKLAPRNNEMYRKIINIEASGKKKEFVLYSAKKDDDKILSAFLSPASDKGRTTLRVGDNMWTYIPAVKRPIRITARERSLLAISLLNKSSTDNILCMYFSFFK